MSYSLYFLFLLIIPTHCLLPPDDSSCHNHCFHQPSESCPPVTSPCKCQRLSNCNNAAVCCNVNAFTLTEGLACANISSTTDIKALHIRNATFESFNLTVHQQVWRVLLYMTITNGNITRIDGKLPKSTKISCLDLSSNHINSIEERALGQLYNLSFLNLSHNNLTQVPSIRMENVTVDISNNTNLACSNLKVKLGNSKLTFTNENETFCITSKDFAWFQTTATLPFSQLKRVHELQKNCVLNCTCSMYRLNLSQVKLASFEVAVNCSNKKFSALPVPLPPNTIFLDVSSNNITSIKELKSESSYENLRYFYADNNQISSLKPLEGTKFINNFDTLSLQRNKIKLLDTYVLDNIQFERNFNQRRVRLGFNNLHCDCSTKKLKVWLLSKLSHIPDHDDIRCENMNAKVTELDPSKLCQSPQDWTDYIYYIITAEVLLLVGLIVKVSYDYWVFKTAGYLPWPASKMPRLPCDWLCE